MAAPVACGVAGAELAGLPEYAAITAAAFGPEQLEIASELFDRGMAELAGLPEYAAAAAAAAWQAEAAASQWRAQAARLLEEHGITLPDWRPPTLGVRDPRAGWILSAALLQVLTDPDIRLRITRAEALTGVTVARDPRTYRPGAALAARVRERDRTCRFPGCGVSARRCDIDHVTPFPHGTTTEGNLICLCRTHHGFKHHARWHLLLLPDGSCTWTAPTGRTHTTTPTDIRTDAA